MSKRLRRKPRQKEGLKWEERAQTERVHSDPRSSKAEPAQDLARETSKDANETHNAYSNLSSGT